MNDDEEEKVDGKKKKAKQPEPYFGEKDKVIVEGDGSKGKGFFSNWRKKKQLEPRLFGKD